MYMALLVVGIANFQYSASHFFYYFLLFMSFLLQIIIKSYICRLSSSYKNIHFDSLNTSLSIITHEHLSVVVFSISVSLLWYFYFSQFQPKVELYISCYFMSICIPSIFDELKSLTFLYMFYVCIGNI